MPNLWVSGNNAFWTVTAGTFFGKVVTSYSLGQQGYVQFADKSGFFWGTQTYPESESSVITTFPKALPYPPCFATTSWVGASSSNLQFSDWYGQIESLSNSAITVNWNSQWGNFSPANTAYFFGYYDPANNSASGYSNTGPLPSNILAPSSYVGIGVNTLSGVSAFNANTLSNNVGANSLVIPTYWNSLDIPDWTPALINYSKNQVQVVELCNGTCSGGGEIATGALILNNGGGPAASGSSFPPDQLVIDPVSGVKFYMGSAVVNNTNPLAITLPFTTELYCAIVFPIVDNTNGDSIYQPYLLGTPTKGGCSIGWANPQDAAISPSGIGFLFVGI